MKPDNHFLSILSLLTGRYIGIQEMKIIVVADQTIVVVDKNHHTILSKRIHYNLYVDCEER